MNAAIRLGRFYWKGELKYEDNKYYLGFRRGR